MIYETSLCLRAYLVRSLFWPRHNAFNSPPSNCRGPREKRPENCFPTFYRVWAPVVDAMLLPSPSTASPPSRPSLREFSFRVAFPADERPIPRSKPRPFRSVEYSPSTDSRACSPFGALYEPFIFPMLQTFQAIVGRAQLVSKSTIVPNLSQTYWDKNRFNRVSAFVK